MNRAYHVLVHVHDPRWRSPRRSDLPATCAWKYDECVEKHPQRVSYIYSTLWIVCACIWNAEQQPSYCPKSALCLRKALQRCVWSDSLNLLQLSSSAMTSFAPPECVMNGTTESHNDHILNRRWHNERAQLSLLSVIWVLDYIRGGWQVKRYDGWNADLDKLPWLSNPRTQKNVPPSGWVWTSKK